MCDRPGSLTRILEELADLGVEQAILVSASPELLGPHALAAGRLDGKGRLGEYLQSTEAAAVRDATRLVAARTPGSRPSRFVPATTRSARSIFPASTTTDRTGVSRSRS